MLEVSSFSRLFPQYREEYLQESWPLVESALEEYGVACNLNLVKGSMTVSTTNKTRNPYIIVKARDLLRLLSRSVPAPQAIEVLKDEMSYDIINIRKLVRKKERFLRRRQRILGPKGVKQIRRIVEDCLKSIMHPLNSIKVLTIKNELAKNPALANESWDRLIPDYLRPKILFKTKKKDII